MSPLTRKIEDRAIHSLETIIKEHPTMSSHITKGDTALSWDGFIRIFQDDNSTEDKMNYDDDIPVQVKGHVENDKEYLSKDRVKYSVDLKDLNNYYRRTGCLYFTILMDENGDDVRIYYSCLYPSKIKEYVEIAVAKGNESTISIPFVRLKHDSGTLSSLCKQFSFEIRKQGSGLGQIVPKSIRADAISQIQKISMTSVGGHCINDLLMGISRGDVVLYSSMNDDGVQIPIQANAMGVCVEELFNAPILAKKKVYYSNFKLLTTVTTPDVKKYVSEGTCSIIVSNNLTLVYSNKRLDIKFRLNTDIFHIAYDAQFLLDLLEDNAFYIEDQIMTVECGNNNPKFMKLLTDMVLVGDVLQKIGISINTPFNSLTDEDKTQIDKLCAIVDRRATINTTKKTVVYDWVFRGKYWPIFIDLSHGDPQIQGYIYNNNLSTAIMCFNSMNHNDSSLVPKFLFIKPEVLANLYYYDYESIYYQIDNSVYNENTADALLGMFFSFIKAYDINGDSKLLDVAYEVLNRLEEAFPDTLLYYVEQGQIEVRRDGELSLTTLLKIEELLPQNEGSVISASDRLLYNYCIFVIKQDTSHANEIYDRLTDSDKERVNKGSIRDLHMRLMKKGNGVN